MKKKRRDEEEAILSVSLSPFHPIGGRGGRGESSKERETERVRKRMDGMAAPQLSPPILLSPLSRLFFFFFGDGMGWESGTWEIPMDPFLSKRREHKGQKGDSMDPSPSVSFFRIRNVSIEHQKERDGLFLSKKPSPSSKKKKKTKDVHNTIDTCHHARRLRIPPGASK